MVIEQPINLLYVMVSQHCLVTHQLNWGHNFKRGKPEEALSTEIVLVSKGAFTPDANEANQSRCLLFIRAWNSLHYRCEYVSWEGLLPGSSSFVAKCIPVFVKVRRCICSSGYPHTTTITLSSIVVSDFLPPLVMTSLLEQAPDWLTGIKRWIRAA